MNNILEACTLYTVDLLKAGMEIREKIENEWGNLDPDCMNIMMNLSDINDFEIPNNAIDFDSFEFDEEELEFILEDMIGRHPYYLVFGKGMKWNGASGYKFCDNLVATCTRNYDISLVLQEQGKNAILCTESSHDVPTGHPTYIIGLSKQEFNKLENSDFSEIEKFALSKF